MSLLNERLLLEEEGFEDAENQDELDTGTDLEDEEIDTADDETAATDDSSEGDEVVDDTMEEPVDDTTSDIQEPTTITYKVTYKLGNHENWSRVDTATEDEAKQTVEDYITKKYPDRGYEFVSVEEYEEMDESLNESMLTDVEPIEDGAAVGMSTVISDLIKDEYETIDHYNAAIATASSEGFLDMIKVLSEIQAEEQLHIGQLQAIMNTLDPNAHLISDGQQEGIEQLSNPIETNI